jgi:RNA 3'-terminal phosphate cyclase (ATP)
MIEIDGGEKSGSGTIVRDCIGFALLLAESLHLKNIRTKRDRPGLRAQHLRAIQACSDICGGSFTGGQVGSREITFTPGNSVRGGEFRWDIGTAGSTIMLALTVIPVSLFADGFSKYVITGGLFQDFAPSAFHLQKVLLPILERMGARLDLTILRPGYVPQGEGIIEMTVQPVQQSLTPISMQAQGNIVQMEGVALASLLKERSVAERMAAECAKVLKRSGYPSRVQVLNDTKENPAYHATSVQAGAALAIWAETDNHCLIGSDMAGARGRSAEFIGKATAKNLLEDVNSGATVDRHLADQLIPFAALAEGWSTFVVPSMTAHVDTRLWLAREVLGAETEIQGNIVKIKGIGYRK